MFRFCLFLLLLCLHVWACVGPPADGGLLLPGVLLGVLLPASVWLWEKNCQYLIGCWAFADFNTNHFVVLPVLVRLDDPVLVLVLCQPRLLPVLTVPVAEGRHTPDDLELCLLMQRTVVGYLAPPLVAADGSLENDMSLLSDWPTTDYLLGYHGLVSLGCPPALQERLYPLPGLLLVIAQHQHPVHEHLE